MCRKRYFSLLLGAGRNTTNLKACLILLETCRGVERERRWFFRARHQHDLVAIELPCGVNCSSQHCFAETTTSEARVRDDILDQTVWLSAARQIWNHYERTGCNYSSLIEPDKYLTSRIFLKLLQAAFSDFECRYSLSRIEVEI
jgi:hypothetical protein